MPENLTHSLSFFQRASEKKSIYDHFIRRNPTILETVIKATGDGLFNINKVLQEHQQNTAECGNYEYTILNDKQQIIQSEIFDGAFNAVMIEDKVVTALFVSANDGVIDLEKTVIVDEQKLVDYDYRVFSALKLVIESILKRVDTSKIKVALKTFFDMTYQEAEIAPEQEQNQNHLDKKAFDIIFYEEDPDKVKSAEYLVKAMLEIAKSDLAKKSRLYYSGISFAKDRMSHTARLVIEKDENIIYSLDSISKEFYITNRKTLQKIMPDEFEGSDREMKTLQIANQLLLAVDGHIEVSDFFNELVRARQ